MVYPLGRPVGYLRVAELTRRRGAGAEGERHPCEPWLHSRSPGTGGGKLFATDDPHDISDLPLAVQDNGKPLLRRRLGRRVLPQQYVQWTHTAPRRWVMIESTRLRLREIRSQDAPLVL